MSRSGLFAAALAVLVAIACPVPAHAQGALVYATGGPSAVWNIGYREIAWQGAGGVELLNGPLGLGGDAGYIYFPAVTKTFDGRGTASSPAAGAVAVTGKATFHFGSTTVDRRVRPFIAAGLTFLASDEFMPLLPVVSGGVDWWATPGVGMRVEVQRLWGSMLTARVGVVLR